MLLNYIIFICIFLDILNSVLNSIQSDPKSWIYSVIIGGITFYIMKFYYKVNQCPSGPLPLPLVGNLLSKNIYYLFFKLMHLFII